MSNLLETLNSLETAQDRNHFLRNVLGSQDCTVTFTKVNGEVRTMPCTLRTDAMPLREANEFHQTRLYKPDSLSVWCLDRSEWRSFRVMNVTDIQPMSNVQDQ